MWNRAFLWLPGVLMFGLSAQALAANEPYQRIGARNVFNLRLPAPDPNHEPLPLPDIKLQGIAELLGKRQVLFKVRLPARPSVPAKEETYILAEGESAGEITVRAIDMKARTVKLESRGAITDLSLDLDGERAVSPAWANPVGAALATVISPAANTASSEPPPIAIADIPPQHLGLPGLVNVQSDSSAAVPSSGGESAGPKPVKQMGTGDQTLLIEARHTSHQQMANVSQHLLPGTTINPKASALMTPAPKPEAADTQSLQ